MKSSAYSIKAVLVTLSLLSLTSCAYFHHGQDDGYVEDSTLTANVKQAYAADPQIRNLHISVDTNDGVVQLNGFVDSDKSEKRAVDLAKEIRGVTMVKDNLAVAGNSVVVAPPH